MCRPYAPTGARRFDDDDDNDDDDDGITSITSNNTHVKTPLNYKEFRKTPILVQWTL